ncbi:MAG: PEP-CTERM sorting domain-containing protein [Cyanobacteriota bacterium]|nr:PEP-CTERM sorting domain-containing protein [Cyanobacteriota bacterium]
MNFKQTLAVAATTFGLAIIPNSASAAIIGVDFGPSGSSTPNNWTLVTGAGTTNDLIDETGLTTVVDIALSSPAFIGNFGANVLASTVPTDPNPIDNIGGNLFSFSGSPLEITFSDLVPNQTYDYWLFGLRDGFDGTNQNVIVNGTSFSQTAGSRVLAINNELGTDTRTLDSYGISVTADALGQIITTISPNNGLYSVAGIAIEAPPDVSSVPEPTSVIALLGLGLGTLASKRKKQA